MSVSETIEKSNEPTCRRGFLALTLKAGVLTCAAGMSAPIVSYLWPVQEEGPGGGFISAGMIRDIPIGASKLIQAHGKPILVLRVSDTDFRAFSAICTHLGCAVNWRKEQEDIFCPCHGGKFDTEGHVTGGPPPSPLPRYPVTTSEGELRVVLKAAQA
jgi:cytochrome b6-f complex iron-sulfur subunit